MSTTTCTHLDQITVTALSAEPGEEWSWCYLDEVAFVLEPGGEEGE